MIHGFHSEDCDDLRYKNDKLEQKIAELQAEIAELKCPKIGVGYYAMPDLWLGIDTNDIYWWIVEKTFYDATECVDDRGIDLEIPDFVQTQESCFINYKVKTLEEQSKLLTDMGFTIIEGDF